MVTVIYIGPLTNPKIRLKSGETIKIKNGVPFNVSLIDWAYMQTSGLYKDVNEPVKEEPKKEKPKKKTKKKKKSSRR